jgi:hypothetical protein
MEVLGCNIYDVKIKSNKNYKKHIKLNIQGTK